MITLPFEYKSGTTLLAELDAEHYITNRKKVIAKLTADNLWEKPVKPIKPVGELILLDNEYAELVADWKAFQAWATDNVTKHLAGQHDQSSHGRRGTIKIGFDNWSSHVIDLIEAAEKIDESRGDGINVVFTEAAGFNGKPKILSQAQFDALENETIYRGVQDESYVIDFKESVVQYGGTGTFGNGTYLSNNATTVIDYGGSIMEMKLLPTANVITFDNKENLKSWTQNLTNEWLDSYSASGKNPYEMQQAQWNLSDDTTNWTAIAMMQGIDAVRIPQNNGEFYTVLLNRGQVAINGDS